MEGFEEFSAMVVSQNRCAGHTASGKKCRTRLREGQYMYCCEAHQPFNKDCLEDGCFCCTEKMVNHKDALHFRCGHVVHRECYYEWMRSSDLEEPICMVCRSEVWVGAHRKKRETQEYIAPESFDERQIMHVLEEARREKQIYKEDYEKTIRRQVFSDFVFL